MEKKKIGFSIRNLFLTWAIVLVVIIVSGIVAYKVSGTPNFPLISIIVSFASFVATSFFSISIYNHNAALREQNAEIRKQTNAVNRRGELFRNLQFIASNFTIIDFVDYVLIYEESDWYINRLKKDGNFGLYLLEEGVKKSDIIERFEDYVFLSIKLPFDIIEGRRAVGKISFRKIKFQRQDAVYRFLPSTGDSTNALILYSESDKRSEAVINLAMRKDSEFYRKGEINPFTKIKIILDMESLLSVIVSGSIEIYFTNPEKMEQSGANKYKINSSQFLISGKMRLNAGKEYDPD